MSATIVFEGKTFLRVFSEDVGALAFPVRVAA